MKQELDYFMQEYPMEWDEGHHELGELILLSDIKDIVENKTIVLGLLYTIMSFICASCDNEDGNTDEILRLSKLIVEVNNL